MGIAKDIIDKQSNLEKARSSFDAHWDEVARLVFPRQDSFLRKETTEGEKKNRDRFDDTAVLALDHGAAAVESVVSPRSQEWHGIAPPEHLADNAEALKWCDDLTKFLFRKRYSAASNFASQIHECYMSLLAFGNAVLIVEDLLDFSIRYKSSHIGEHYFQENARGKVDTDYRKYKLTAKQAFETFKDKTPEKIMAALEKDPSERFEFIHAVVPDGEVWDSFHIFPDAAELIDRGFYKSFPYIISRWTTSPNETYGRSPAMSVLSEIKMLNQMRKTEVKMNHLASSPPILAADQATIRKFSLKPDAINYGTLDMNGNPLVRPYQTGANTPVTKEAINTSREFINRAFFLNLFQILVDAPSMTATEVLQRAQEKGQLLTPAAGRQMNELLEPIIMREIDIYEDYGIFEDGGFLALPDVMKEAEGNFNIHYTNPLTRMQLSEEALGVERTVQSILPLAQFDPSLLDMIDFKEYAKLMRNANGAPAKLFRSDEELAAIQKAREEQRQAQMIAQAMPQAATAIKDLAQAESYGNA